MINLKNKDFSICLLRQSTCFSHAIFLIPKKTESEHAKSTGLLDKTFFACCMMNIVFWPITIMIRKNEQAIKVQTNIIVIACGLVFSHLIGISLQCNNMWEIFLV